MIWIHITVITCTANDWWWVWLSSLMSFETSIFSLIQTLDSESILFGKVMSVFDELPNSRVENNWLSFFWQNKCLIISFFYSLVLTYDIMVSRLLFSSFGKNLPVLLPSWQHIPHFKTVSYNNQWLKLIWMKLNNDMTLNDMGINSLHLLFGINRCDIQSLFYMIWIYITVITCTENELWWVELSSLISSETIIFH